MRETKFRAWDTVNKEFIPLNHWGKGEDMPVKNIAILLDGTILQLEEDFVTDVAKPGKVYPKGQIILQQWSGLFDKNNVEIFEGDITDYGEIVLTNGSFRYKKNGSFIHKNHVVIGNIFEHPELLKEVK